MGEYVGRINVSKDAMLFVVNEVFEKGIKESTTKENILKMIPDIYKEADDEKIIEMLPYDEYKTLEKLIEYVKTSDDISKFVYSDKSIHTRFLEEAMIIVMRAKHNEYNYSINPGVLESLQGLFSAKNKALAKRYGDIEKLTVGMLYSYGVVDFDFLRKQLCKYMNEIITDEELKDILFTRLNLNLFANYFNIKWTNTGEVQPFVTYLYEEFLPIEIGEIAEEQKSRGLKYKQFSRKEILEREEYFYDKSAQELYRFLSTKNRNFYEGQFKRLVKLNELGIDILGELSDLCQFESELEMHRFMELFMSWHNNSPQYLLCGYAPSEFRKVFAE